MTLNELIQYLLEARDIYGNLPEIYIVIDDKMEELTSVEVEERQTLILVGEDG